jgi:hypothetical protein
MWKQVRDHPNAYAKGAVWQGKMIAMLSEVFVGATLRGYGGTATWFGRTLTAS